MGHRQKQHQGRSVDDDRDLVGRDVQADDRLGREFADTNIAGNAEEQRRTRGQVREASGDESGESTTANTPSGPHGARETGTGRA